jgi:hypothetical protein
MVCLTAALFLFLFQVVQSLYVAGEFVNGSYEGVYGQIPRPYFFFEERTLPLRRFFFFFTPFPLRASCWAGVAVDRLFMDASGMGGIRP